MTEVAQKEDDQALAAEYALGLLTPPDARAFEGRLSREPVLRAQYVVWAEDLVRMTDDIAPVAPPPRTKTALETRLFATEKTGFLAWIGLVPALIGGVLAAALVYFVTSFGLLQTPGDPQTRLTAQIAAQDESLLILAVWDDATQTLQLDRVTGAAVPGRVLELWLIAGDAAPVSLGVLPQDPTSGLTVAPAHAAMLSGGTLAVSDEPPGGSPTGAPTGAVLAAGPVLLS